MFTVYSKPNCPFCDQAKALLKSKNLPMKEMVLGVDYTREQLLEKIPTARTVPQIFSDDQLIGGFTELKAYLA